MAQIPIYDAENNLSYNATATIESSVVAGNGSGKEFYYIKVSTTQKAPDTTAIPAQVAEDIAGTDVTSAVQDAVEIIMEYVDGDFMSSDSAAGQSSSSSGSSESSESTSSQSESSVSSKSTSSQSTYSLSSQSTPSSESSSSVL
ncbi:MAG: hypothetical protein M0R32_09090 [Candidatus Cloacimonetes bacterium]|jgi:hypothetical protein|nr:hypothetical protein [Candidatus Cloacimonadota bacterium]